MIPVRDLFESHLVRYLLKHPVTAVTDVAADPLQLWMTIRDGYAAKRERSRPRYQYEFDANWEQRLHESLGVPWPCNATAEFWTVWSWVNSELEAKGIEPGPESFQWWNDGDAGFARAIWCLARHLRPKKIVETGVAHGVTSRCILEALNRNGDGHLWSIDLPPVDRFWRQQVGAAVGDRYADRWTTSRVRAGGGFPSCFPSLDRSIFSFTTACTVNATYVSNWIEPGRPWHRRAHSS